MLDVKEIYGVRTPTPEWLKHKSIVDTCRELGCDPPAPVTAFFETNPLTMHVEIAQAVQDFRDSGQSGIEISLNELPESTTAIRLAVEEVHEPKKSDYIHFPDGMNSHRSTFDPDKLAEHDAVTEVMEERVKPLRATIADAKAKIWEILHTYRAEVFIGAGVEYDKNAKKRFTMRDLTGRYTIKCGYKHPLRIVDAVAFEAAIKLIKEIVNEKIDHVDDSELREFMLSLIDTKDREKLYSLKERKFTHPKWESLIELIDKSLSRPESKDYIGFYERKDSNTPPKHISLNFSDIEV